MTGDRLDIVDGQVGAGEDDRPGIRGPTDGRRDEVRIVRLGHPASIPATSGGGLAANDRGGHAANGRRSASAMLRPVLAFIDTIVIPFLKRWGRFLLIREHEIDAAERFFERYGAATAFLSRLLPVVRTFISFPAGVARMPLGRFIAYSTAGAFLWSTALVFAGTQLGIHWQDIRHALQPFDLLIVVVVVLLAALFVWWRLGRPGWRPRRTGA